MNSDRTFVRMSRPATLKTLNLRSYRSYTCLMLTRGMDNIRVLRLKLTRLNSRTIEGAVTSRTVRPR